MNKQWIKLKSFCFFFFGTLKNILPLQSNPENGFEWSVRLGVRTPGFHPGNRGSIPLRTTVIKFCFNLGSNKMANHQSSIKRIRQTEKRRVHNKYFAKTTRNAIKQLRDTEDKKAAEKLLPEVSAMLDKLSKKNIIHSNKAGNLKSKLKKHVNQL